MNPKEPIEEPARTKGQGHWGLNGPAGENGAVPIHKNHRNEKIERYINELLSARPPKWNVEAARENKPAKWNYIDGCMMLALLRLYEATGDGRYQDAAKAQMDVFIAPTGDVLGYDPEARALDDINGAKALLLLSRMDPDARYAIAAERFLRELRDQPRNAEGSFWHKRIYPNQVWLDGLYMVMPFYLAMAGTAAVHDACAQFRTAAARMRDEKTGLFYHGYDATRKAFWADPVTGRSPNFWTRAMGWYAMALVDSIECIDEMLFDERMGLIDQMRDLFDALLAVRDAESGLYLQVTDRRDAPGNYLETSGSCAIAYAMLKAARLRLVPQRYGREGERTFRAVLQTKLIETDGRPTLRDICLVAGLGGMPGKGTYKERDGSVAYYLSEPIVTDDAKGVAPFLFGYAELLRGGVS